uniref:Uncharacterized protein n=1 Tax=Arion vulgaris TaxID=1028688 RepID=A0A0B7B004_9EUPU
MKAKIAVSTLLWCLQVTLTNRVMLVVANPTARCSMPDGLKYMNQIKKDLAVVL